IRREAALWKTLRHPYICLSSAPSKMKKSFIYLISPFMKNGTALGYARGHPNVNHTLLVSIISSLQVAEALLYLHTQSPPVIHGDLKGVGQYSFLFPHPSSAITVPLVG
ncbi:hypothetical protein BOTBODRAFT_112624, partial [Botryobasidium botryosum FD-172 SS1]